MAVNKNHLGLTLGILTAFFHLVWALLVAVGIAKDILAWILPLHFVSLVVPISSFTMVNAIILVAMAFIGGYITGWVAAWLWNWLEKKK